MLKRNLILLLLIIFINLPACYSVKVDRQVTALDHVELRQNFFVFGLIGDKEVNLVEQCPRGASGFSERFTFADIILTVISLGIYTPRTVFVNCAN